MSLNRGEERGLGGSRALGVALVVEAVLVAAIGYWISHAPPPVPVPHKAPMKVALVTLPKPPKKVPPKPKPAPPPKPQPHRPVIRHVVHRLPPPPPQPAPIVQQQAVVVPPPPPPPEVSASPDEIALFEDRVREAIQSAVVYPAAARMLGRQGRVRVAFDYRDGAVSNVHIVQGTGFGPLDSAAIAAVRNAQYPQPTTKLRHKRLHMVVWVRFDEVQGN